MSGQLSGNDVFHAQRLVAYFNVASGAVLFYEHCITFDEEVHAIWTARWTMSKMLYILMKYSAFVQVGIVMWQQNVPIDMYEGCLPSFHVTAWFFVIGLAVGELLLSIRTWAVWKKPQTMGVLLLLFWLVSWGAIFGIVGIFLQTVRFDPNPSSPFPGCFISRGDPIFFIDFIILLLYDTAMLVLILIPAYKAYRRGGTSQFVQSVYRDGIVYYAYLFALSLLNILVIVKLPFDLSTLLLTMERVLHAVLTGRVVLNIHQHSRQREHESYVSSNERLTGQDHVVLVPMPSSSQSPPYSNDTAAKIRALRAC